MGTMTGHNYISLFWGDDDAQHERGLERDELRIFNQGMKEVLEATVPVNPDGPVQEIDQEELPADEGPRFEVQGDKTLSTLTALLEGPKPSQQPIMEARWDEDSIRKELADEFDIEEEDMEVDIDIEEEKDFGIDYWRVEAEGNEYMVFADTDDAITFAQGQLEQQLDDEPELFDHNFLRDHIFMTNTDRRLAANDMVDSYVDDIDDDRAVDEADMQDEYDEAEEAEDWNRMEKIVEEAREKLREEMYDDHYERMGDPIQYFVHDEGIYSVQRRRQYVLTVPLTSLPVMTAMRTKRKKDWRITGRTNGKI
jgi:hypothetical protein